MSKLKHAASVSHNEATIAELHADRAFAVEYLKSALEELDVNLRRTSSGSVLGANQHPCSYQFRRVVERDLGYLGIADEETSDLGKMDFTKVNRVISEVINHDVYFLKRETFVSEAEYRFVWLVEGVADQFIDLFVPDARRYCSRWEDQGEWIAIDNAESTYGPPGAAR
jgi:hypothetical protein